MTHSSHARSAAEVLMVGIAGRDLDPASRGFYQRVAPGGTVLFRRNIDQPQQTRELTDALRSVAGPSHRIAVDQEGGRVSRLAPLVGPTPSAAELAADGPESCLAWGRWTAEALRWLGIGIDFAPVVDLDLPGSPNGIGDRAFGNRPDRVVESAGAFLDGLQDGGVAGCLKHYPGLGRTQVDSHHALPRVELSREELEAHELQPFRRLQDRAAGIMISHADYDAFPGGGPATANRALIQGLLRDAWQYDGWVVSDDLEMGAVSALDRDGAMAVAAIAAGCDCLLYCSRLDRAERAWKALQSAAEHSAEFGQRLAQAAARCVRISRRWGVASEAPPQPWGEQVAAAQRLVDALTTRSHRGIDPTEAS